MSRQRPPEAPWASRRYGSAALWSLVPVCGLTRSSPPQVNSQISVGHGLLVELLITFQLVFTVFATCDPKRTDLGGSAGLAIGFAVAIGHLFAVSSPPRRRAVI